MAWRKAITEMITEKQLESGAARFVNFDCFAFYHHPRFDLGGARGNQLAFDFDEANEARGERTTFFEKTKRGDIESDLASSIKDAQTRGHFDWTTVYCDTENGILHT